MSEVAKPLSVTVTLDRHAIERGVFQRLAWSLANWPMAALAVALIALIGAQIALAPTASDARFVMLLLAGGALLYALLLWLVMAIAVHRTTRLPGLLAPVTYTFSEEGVDVRAEGGTSNLAWAYYGAARETRDFFLITLRSRQAHIIPRAQMTSSEIAALRAILRAHLPRGLRIRSDSN